MKSYQPDYPRPQLARSNWENLNGYWQFAFDDQGVGLEQGWANGVPGTQKILVPFTYETKASGIGDESVHTRVWYSRTVQLSQLPARAAHAAAPGGMRLSRHRMGERRARR